MKKGQSDKYITLESIEQYKESVHSDEQEEEDHPKREMANTFEEYLQQLPPDKQWITHTIVLPDEEKLLQLASALRDGVGIGASDGSFKDGYGTAGFILTGRTMDVSIIGVAQCHGQRHLHDAYRAELTGLYALMVLVESLEKFYGVGRGKVTIACDNDAALDKCFDEESWCTVRDGQWDIIRSIKEMVANSPIKTITENVKGHSDKDKQWEDMTRMEQLNVHCDNIATKFRILTTNDDNVIDEMLPGQGWRIRIKGRDIVSKMDENLHAHCSKGRIFDEWEKRQDMGPDRQDMISWEGMYHAMRNITLARKLFIVKRAARRDATGVEMVQRKERDHDFCPRCRTQHEDNTHILRCRATGADAQWEYSMENFKREINKLPAPPDLPEAIQDMLTRWREGRIPREAEHNWTDDTKKLIDLQEQVGWELMLEGCISKGWEEIVQMYITSTKKNMTTERWISALIRKLWEVAWDMWDHRNQCLHKLNPDEVLLGIQKVKTAIQWEMQHGPDVLMTEDERALFKVKPMDME